MRLSVVVPVYGEEDSIPEFLRRTTAALGRVTDDFEIIFCMDPSPDRTEPVVLEARAADPRIKLLKFSRRVGQPMATLAGLQYSSGEAVVVIDVDLQDPPELIEAMVSKLHEGFEVVYAQRITRKGETRLKRLVSALGYRLINRIAAVDIPPNTGDFRLMSRRVVNEVLRLRENHGFLRGMVAVVGFRQVALPFERDARHAGRGNYNRFVGSLRIGMNGVICFSNYLLTLSSWMGFVIAGMSLMLGVVYFVMKLAGTPFPMGNPTIVILVAFIGGIQLISVGILGEYVGRIYDEVKQRPRFIVDSAQGFDGGRPQALHDDRA
jgi:glycosyltransferase involved in cell wall biosynthesis